MRKLVSLMKAVCLLLFIFSLPSYGQSQTVSGTVTDDKGAPVSGATVRVVGTTAVTQTSDKGSFTVRANNGQTLQITSVGFESTKVTVRGSSVSVSLKPDVNELEEVVVAMDIKRKPRELGYSTQTVKGKEIAETQRDNFVNSLQGRVSGLTITPTNGQAGASSQIVLRGFNSLSLSNQPLFVVDGVILDNQTMDETSNGGTQLGLASDRPNRNNDYTNRIADINPADIESVTVLKGPEATALYGSQASSGAIVITTKKPKLGSSVKLAVNYDNNFNWKSVTRFNDINKTYGLGSNGVSSNIFNTGSGSYFGAPYPTNTPDYDNVHHFFRNAFAQTHNLGIDFGGKVSTFRASLSYLDQDGIVPGNNYKKYSVRITNQTKIASWLDINPSITYTSSVLNKPLRGAGGYLQTLYVWPKDNDMQNYLSPNGNKIALFAADGNAELDNPLFSSLKNKSQDNLSRWVATLGVNLNPTSWLSIAGRFGYDTYKMDGFIFVHPGSFQNGNTRALGGTLDNYWRNYEGYNHTITATARKTVGDFGFRLMGGTMWQDYQTRQYAIYGTGLSDSSRTDSSNTKPNTRVRLLKNGQGEYNRYITRQLAYFGEFAVSYKNLVFLNYTHRFEAASIFPTKNRNYNYPGASLSAIVSDIFPGLKKNGVINYWKLRTSLAGTARLSDPYRNQSVFVNNFASNTGGAFSYGFDNNNPDLKPERQNTYEVGTELKMFDNRVSIDAAYYNTYCYDQISQGFRNSYATGFVLNTQNAATTRNQGVEVSLDVTPIRKKDFDWNIRFNFNHMWSRVIDLPQSIIYEYYIADTWLYGNARGGLVRNNSTGTMTSYGYMRNNNGDILINPANGLPVIDQTFKIHGDRTPKFTLGTNNSFRYRNWNLSFLWDLKVGGDVFNATEMFLTYQGKSQRTADRTTPRVVQGVLNDGYQNTATPTKNTIAINPYYLQTYYTTMPEEEFIQKNVNWLRMRDITLSYQLSERMLRKLKHVKSLSVFFTGNDLILISNYKGADPASNGNTASSKGVGGFGFDYGNVPTPISLNFGLRANF
ncbi:SusC/RagA family TonB-linked outer membrane protein [Sediminibacterium soli]|uniref:SusC/RagA family TonB-linked outer membrane protein n=1 Tax=Sediminibacterium soli TaxID=2698829 RepID=UPI00137A3F64|nr:SusC/RagA family TonB-linked outer membrane protein [Sediminibacterium soli]NCI46073.1 SusC/RagA family TonB-linked outer membrane protein [Sediminibacterium soli]